ncbi:Uncharacterised protein [Kingella potus]|uniref:Epimerase n=1 Tax=Kingella potus TaxID=265175 RepID=A0A377R597_9NEIS|nr:DoxX-like family protein [Kingella potus]UOP00228.1 DoxX-like family protein [Kingella potus]STR02715.1 Uncharacterised protein [Kingella potus]
MDTRPRIPNYLPYSLGILWLWSGLQPLLSARQESEALLAAVGFQTAWQYPVLLAASLLDVSFGLLCFSRARRMPALWAAQAATVAAYSAVIACALPEMWLHPFAPLVKNLPVFALIVYLAQAARRQAV